MPIKNGKEEEYKAWKNAMIEKGLGSSVRLAKWFFDRIDLKQFDIKTIICIFCLTPELYNKFGIKDNEKWRIFFSIKAIIDFHDRGEEFRMAWNFFWLGDKALEAEAKADSGKRYLHNPFLK